MGVRIENLARSFGPVEAVRGISLEIREGETFGLLGPNGAGKTTTLSMLSSLLAPSAGDAWIFGKSLRREVSEVKRIVGLAPEEIALYPDLTAEENLLFFGRVSGVRGRRLRARVEELLELVGLALRRGDRVRTFSGGMKRRLNLACSLVHTPRLLLLDEPTVGVDPQSRDNLFRAVESLASEGTTVLYTTHYMEGAERLCDRIAIMDEGRIAAVGTCEELLEIVGMGEVIEIRGGVDAARLRRVEEVMEIESSGGVTRLLVRDAARALGPVGAILADSEDPVEGVEVYPVNLERVFMYLTGKDLRD